MEIEKAIEILKYYTPVGAIKLNEIERAIEWLICERENYAKDGVYYHYMNLAISALEKQLNNGWIPVKKKLPDTNKDILVTLNDGKVVPARYLFADNLNHITAWQPLPPAYKEEEKNE